MYWYYGHMAHIPEIKLSYLILFSTCALSTGIVMCLLSYFLAIESYRIMFLCKLYISSIENSLLSLCACHRDFSFYKEF